MSVFKEFLIKIGVAILILVVTTLVAANELNKGGIYNASELGFSFRYPSGFIVDTDKKQPEIITIAPFASGSSSFRWIMIDTSTNYPSYTPTKWVKTWETVLGKAGHWDTILENSPKRLIGGQEAIKLYGSQFGDMFVLNSPDSKRHIKIGSFSRKKDELLDEELGTI